VGARAGVNAVGRDKFLASARDRTSLVQPELLVRARGTL
jgi:hypothetical protein